MEKDKKDEVDGEEDRAVDVSDEAMDGGGREVLVDCGWIEFKRVEF